MANRGIAFALISVLLLLFAACGHRSVSPNGRIAALGAKYSPPRIIALDVTLSRLDAIETPAGVKPELFEQLKREMVRQLMSCRVSKFTSAPPTGFANSINDLEIVSEGGGLSTITWSYKNLGDYNQDSTVGIEDLTTLAVHYGENYAPGDVNCLLAVVDGSGNGTIDSGDVTPIAQNFGAECAGYSLRGAANHPNSLVETAKIGMVAFAEATGNGRKKFSIQSLGIGCKYFAVAAYDSAGMAGVLSNIVEVVAGNNLPVAALTATPVSGEAPLVVSFDASGSYDTGGTIIRYDYDFDGDGIWDAYDAVNTVSWTYANAGNFDAKVRVTDNAGAQAVDLVSISVNVVGNIPPIADLQALPTYGEVPLAVSFDASSSYDSDGSLVRYDYDFNNDGIWDAYDAANAVYWTYMSPGSYEAKVRITDSDGAQATDLTSISVNVTGNELPIADLQASPTSGDAPLWVSFDASSSYDSDGSLVRYDYDFDSDGIWDAYDAVDMVSWAYTNAGNYSSRVRVTDDVGAQSVAYASITVNVAGNDLPVADLQSSPVSGYAPLAVSFDASSSYDADGAIVRYDYDFDDDGIWDAYDAAAAISWTYTASGSHSARVRVTDDDGAQATDSVSITVNLAGNDAPFADLQASSASGDAPLAVYFDASGSYDSDGAIVRYDYDFDDDGIWDAYDAANSVFWTYIEAGNYDAKVQVTDDAGAQATDLISITVNVVGNSPPIADLQASPAGGDAPLNVSFDASNSYDLDGIIVRYDYDFDDDGIWDAYDAPAAVSWLYAVAGSYDARMRVTDDIGAQATDSVSITVNVAGNDLPVADLQPSPDSGDAPLVVSFDSSGSNDPDGAIVRFDYDFDNDGIWDAYDAADTVSWQYSTAGSYDAKLRVTDNSGAQGVDLASITVNAVSNELPVADLQAALLTGDAPLLVNFSAASSYDPDGVIVRYDYDFDDNGIWDAYDAANTVSWLYTSSGYYSARLRVTDDAGAQTSDTVLVTVKSWHSLTADNSPNQVGEYSSLVVANGRPAICYYDNTPDDLKYVRALDASGTVWGTPITLDSTGSVGLYASMCIVNGNPAIAYYNDTSDDLKYVRASNPEGTAWGIPVTVAATGNVGQYTSLAVVNGNPAVSYRDVTNLDLLYVRATDANGSAWGAQVAVASTGDVGYYTSMLVVNGNPAISYFDETNDDLMFVRATDADGTAWAAASIVDAAGNTGKYNSMIIVNGNPAISYFDDTNDDLRYVRATSADGSAWAVPITLDSLNSVGMYTSMAIINGRPAISYRDVTNTDLKYIRALDVDGTGWEASVRVDGVTDVGYYSSLALVNGNPGISYYDVTDLNLKYATYY
jgi:PKD repeat protein